MKSFHFFWIALCFSTWYSGPDLYSQNMLITVVFDADLSGGLPKGVEVFALETIDSLEHYSLGIAINGKKEITSEFNFPDTSLQKGTFLILCRGEEEFLTFTGFDAHYYTGVPNGNGDDVYLLLKKGVVTDCYGEFGTDGSGTEWEYTDGYAFRKNGSQPSPVFDPLQWEFRKKALGGFDSNQEADEPVPFFSFTAGEELSGNAFLRRLSVEDEVIDNFHREVYSYQYQLEQGMDEHPEITAEPEDTGATVEILPAVNLSGNTEERTAEVRVTAPNGVSVKTYRIEFLPWFTNLNINLNRGMQLYPNPAVSIIVVGTADSGQPIEIFDLSGKLIKQIITEDTWVEIDISTLPEGIYILSQNENREIFIKQQ